VDGSERRGGAGQDQEDARLERQADGAQRARGAEKLRIGNDA
jgi:hypothetical protein